MDSQPGNNLLPLAKPLAQLGRDEMNLAEFPITLLTDRVPKDQTEAIYQDEIFDDRTQRTLTRKLTIKAGGYGLTTPADDEVILALIQITRQKNNFTNRKVEFSRLELIRMLAWPSHGASYDRIELALDRWMSVYLKYENAWRDNRTKSWTSPKDPEGFHIIDNYKLYDSRSSGEQLDLLQSYIVWNQVIFDSFQAGYLKPLDYDLCMGLRNSTAKRMYRFLDKRFHHKADWSFDLKELAHAHIGLGRNYEGPAHLKRNLMPAIAELEAVGFLEPLPTDERFTRNGKDWKVRLIQKGGMAVALLPASDAEPSPPPLVAELVKRGVTASTAADLVQKHPADYIQLKIDVVDWMAEKKDKRIEKSPAGYLVKSITSDYATPKGFVSRADRQQAEQARQARERQAAEDRRQKQQEEARKRADQQQEDDHWTSLSPDEQSQLDADALANADPATRDAYESVKRMGGSGDGFITILRRDYIRQLLKNRENLPAEA
jgi:hypothetical protein